MKKTIFALLLICSFFIMPNVKADFKYVKGIMTNTSVALRRTSDSNKDNDRIKDDEGINNITLSLPETFEILGEENTYYKIHVQYKGFYYTGYIPKKYSKIVGTYNVKDSTVQEMRNLGFDDTYSNKLAVLKTIYPNWSFIPYDTKIDFNHAAQMEGKEVSNNLISGSNTSLRSTADAALNADGTYKRFDNGSWYAASIQTIKYFLDPRNFLNEGHVFMFETLQYNANVHDNSSAAINEVLRKTFMDSNFSSYKKAFACKEGYGICLNDNERNDLSYASILTEAGKNKDVSPIHLATRLIQEQGTNGKSSIISGNGYEGANQGYYNYFNIAASGNSAGTIVSAALNYAANRGWNSPYASIIGGTEAIRNWYISKGQDTMYFQKFDVVAPASYNHQYMQNIRAPYSEAYSTYIAYHVGSLMDKPFTFKIPTYTNMPAYTTIGAEGNDENALKTLNISDCYLMPSFTPSATSYSCNIPKSVTNVTVSATTMSQTSTVSGIGNINLPNDENIINVIVTSGSGKTRTYSVTVRRVNDSEFTPDDILARLGFNNNAGVLSGITLGTTGNSLITKVKNAFPTSNIKVSNNNIVGTGTTLTVNNNGSKTYNVLIYGDNNGDGVIDILDLLKTQKHLLGSDYLKDLNYKATDVNKDGTVDILDLLIIQKNILGSTKISQ